MTAYFYCERSGNGAVFTGDTPVNSDIIVYAVFTKKADPAPGPDPKVNPPIPLGMIPCFFVETIVAKFSGTDKDSGCNFSSNIDADRETDGKTWLGSSSVTASFGV